MAALTQRHTPETIEDYGYVNSATVAKWLAAGRSAGQSQFEGVLAKARQAEGLSPAEAAVLLQADEARLPELLDAARAVKEAIYGSRIVLFAPLYISNHCVNHCTYCGYAQCTAIQRRRLTTEEIRAETAALIRMGHKRIALEVGEDPENCSLDYILEAIGTIYSVRVGNASIRRINVNIAAADTAAYRRLQAANIGTYILFQETYHRPTYRKVHPQGPKHDYEFHLTAMDRAMQAGLDDVGLGVLLGLHDHRHEVLALLAHAEHLETAFGVGPHTVSIPRLRPAAGMNLGAFPHLVSDSEFQRVAAVLRLALPYAGLILSTREEPALRDRLIHYGISQISAGSCTGVGGYQERLDTAAEEGAGAEPVGSTAQFDTGDHRSCDAVVRSLTESGFLPSFCTACYRQHRTGERFMRLAKTGRIQNVCQPNAALTFQEFLEDHASPETKQAAEPWLRRHTASIPSPRVRTKTEEWLAAIRRGARDLRL